MSDSPTQPVPSQNQTIASAPGILKSSSTTNPRLQFPSATEIRAKSTRNLKIIAILTLILFFLNIFLIYLSQSRIKQNKTIKEQIITTGHNSQNLEIAVEFLNTQADQMSIIKKTLPNEAELVEFIQTIEVIAKTHATNHQLKFSVKSPQGLTGEKFIPFIIELSTNIENTLEFLKKLEKLPYIVELTSLETEKFEGSNSILKVTITSRVYVRDPFKPETPTDNTQPLKINLNP